ncbi:MAG TPA: cyclic nucleotide-binding domain-containing protein, partial [Actinomycetota bacterium]|nr:cyclic nucleotide-binding domain-containing protein [Actinomycetota bacterium]
YGPFFDFGFSKSGEDALSRWGREEMIREIVRAIRVVQPLVVISRWWGGPEDGHGQHQAVGLAIAEAFDATADPGRFPELDDQGLPPWRPQKLYRSVGRDWQPGEDVVFGTVLPEYEDGRALRINTGVVEPRSGRTYQELAAMASNVHQSQALAFLPERGDFFYYYRLERGPPAETGTETSFFDGLDPSLTGIVERLSSDRLTKLLAEARTHAEESVRALGAGDRRAAGREVLKGLDRMREARAALADEGVEEGDRPAIERALDGKVRAFEEAAADCLGISLECLAEETRVTGGDRVAVTTRLWTEEVVNDVTFRVETPDGWAVHPAHGSGDSRTEESATVTEAGFTVGVPVEAELTAPYWLRHPRSRYRYVWPERGPLGSPFDPPLLTGVCQITVDGRRLSLSSPAVHRETFAGGYRELALTVLPSVALAPKEQRRFVPMRSAPRHLELSVTARCLSPRGAAGQLLIESPEGWDVLPRQVAFDFSAEGESRAARFDVTLPADPDPGVFDLQLAVETGDVRSGVVLNPVRRAALGLPGPPNESNAIAEVYVILPATVSIHVIDAQFVPTLRCGYVTGVEAGVGPALERFGVDVAYLSEEDLVFGDLSRFDTVVLGPNAYLVRSDVRKAADRLLEYVDGGGTLIVQYQGYGYEQGRFAPYPFRFHQPHDRVTLPDAPIEVLRKDHTVLHLPNELRATDFDGWVHDRGLYFFGEWDRRYTPILASNDPGEDPKRGGLLEARYGRGTYVYCAYSLYRQIPAGVPGAFRLFANLMGLAEARIQERRERARTVPLFSSLTDEQLYPVARLMSERWIDDGEYLCRQGDRGSELYLVLDGEVEVIKESDGASSIVSVAGAGEALGDLAVLTDLPRAASLRARGLVKLLVMRGEHFRSLLREHPDLSLSVTRVIAERLAATEERAPSPSPSD